MIAIPDIHVIAGGEKTSKAAATAERHPPSPGHNLF